jgi:hypothetical protein
VKRSRERKKDALARLRAELGEAGATKKARRPKPDEEVLPPRIYTDPSAFNGDYDRIARVWRIEHLQYLRRREEEEAMKADLARRLARLEEATAPPEPKVEVVYLPTIAVDASLPPEPTRNPGRGRRYGPITRVEVQFVEPRGPSGSPGGAPQPSPHRPSPERIEYVPFRPEAPLPPSYTAASAGVGPSL